MTGGEIRSSEPPSQYAELEWAGPFALSEVIPGEAGVCWVAADEAAGWRAILEASVGPDGQLRPGVRWGVTRPAPGDILIQRETLSLDAAVLDAERFIEALLELAPAERLLSQALEPGDAG